MPSDPHLQWRSLSLFWKLNTFIIILWKQFSSLICINVSEIPVFVVFVQASPFSGGTQEPRVSEQVHRDHGHVWKNCRQIQQTAAGIASIMIHYIIIVFYF